MWQDASAHKVGKEAPCSESDHPQWAVSCTLAWPGSGGGTTRAVSFVGSCWCRSPPCCPAPSWHPALPPVGPPSSSTPLRAAMPALSPKCTPASMLEVATADQVAEKIVTGASAVAAVEAALPMVAPSAAPPRLAPAASSACFLAIWSLYRFGCKCIEEVIGLRIAQRIAEGARQTAISRAGRGLPGAVHPGAGIHDCTAAKCCSDQSSRVNTQETLDTLQC